jgi:hypothetical protein
MRKLPELLDASLPRQFVWLRYQKEDVLSSVNAIPITGLASWQVAYDL